MSLYVVIFLQSCPIVTEMTLKARFPDTGACLSSTAKQYSRLSLFAPSLPLPLHGLLLPADGSAALRHSLATGEGGED